MENIRIVEIDNPNGEGSTTFVVIDLGNGEFTSTEKSIYDKQQAEQSTPSVIDEA